MHPPKQSCESAGAGEQSIKTKLLTGLVILIRPKYGQTTFFFARIATVTLTPLRPWGLSLGFFSLIGLLEEADPWGRVGPILERNQCCLWLLCRYPPAYCGKA